MLKTHGCLSIQRLKITLDNFMAGPVILLARGQMAKDNRLSLETEPQTGIKITYSSTTYLGGKV